MSKTKDELLLDYRKSNKERRVKIVARAGFLSEAEYLKHLMGPDTVAIKPTIHNVHIVDISYSMSGGKIESAVEGVNIEMEELKKDTAVEYTQTIVEFSASNQIFTRCNKIPIKSCSRYSTRTLGSTALNQAAGETLAGLLRTHTKGEKVLVKIFTDGEENASTGPYRSSSALANLIKECEDTNDFTVTFVGTERDVKNVIDHLHIDASNTLSHDNTTRGVQQAFFASVGATQLYSQKVLAKKEVKKGFYKDIKTK